MPDVIISSIDGGQFSAYLSFPSRPRGPAVITMHQIFGVNAEMRGFTDNFAAQGYVAICPDLFWRQQPGVQLAPGTPEAFAEAVGFARGFDPDKGVADLQAAVAFVRALPSSNRMVGTVGYCLGGLMAFLMAARSDAQCNVGYFGVGIEKHIGDAAHLRGALMLHIPEQDHIVPPPAQAVVRQALLGKAELHIYPNADHAFNRVGGPSYDKTVTELADARTAEFLRRHLGA